jgi:hypothetical protein
MSKIYLLSGLAEAQKTELRQAGVIYSAWNDETISIEERLLEQTLQILQARASETATEFEGLVQLTLHPRRPQNAATRSNRVLTTEQSRSRENYIAACAQRIAESLQLAKKSLEAQRKELPTKIERFVMAKRNLALSRSVPNEDGLDETFGAEFERLVQTDKVLDVRVTAQAILVYTDTLYATARDTNFHYEVGKFLIVIDFDGRNGGIRWFNASRRINASRPGMNAPNVYEDGTAYQDELIATFYELVARLQFAAVVDMAIQFIEEVTNDDLAPTINRWPVATEGEQA